MDAHNLIILNRLLRLNAIQVNKEELRLQLLSHPSFPSLHSLTGVLQHFGIDNVAAHLPTTLDTLEQLPTNFIANVKKNGVDELALVERQRSGISMTHSSSEKATATVDQFLSSWTGIILAVEKNEVKAAFKRSAIEHSMLRGIYLLAIALIGLVIWAKASIFTGLYFLSSITGLVFSIIIAKLELGLQSNSVNKFCQISERTSCFAVLQSSGAMLFGWVKLSDLSLIFFGTMSIGGLLSFIAGISLSNIVLLIAFVSVPVVIYSLYYQYVVVGKWCPLCLAIVGVLFVQMLLTTLMPAFSMDAISIGAEESLLFLGATLIAVMSWDFLKPLLIKQQKFQELQVQHLSFKRDFQIFNTLYQQESQLAENALIEGEIILGNPNAKLEILLVTTPACYYCKQAHQDVAQLLKENGEQLKITIRFNVSIEDATRPAYLVCSLLLLIYRTEGSTACQKLLHEVYQDKVDLKQWLEKQEYDFDRSWTDHILTAQREWCTHQNVNFTPAFYLNGKPLPKAYQRTELRYFLEDLSKQESITETPRVTSEQLN